VAAAVCLVAPAAIAAGSGWSIQRTPNPPGAQSSGLFSVSCLSASDCLAVGSYYKRGTKPLSERWNGHAWSIDRAQSPAGATFADLDGVSCVSPNACTAVGLYQKTGGALMTLAERWNGSKWSIEKTPNPRNSTHTELDGVSCPSTHACTAVGFYRSTGPYRTLVERWNGSTWSIDRSPRPTGASTAQLLGVSCPSTKACTAAGNYQNGSSIYATLIERWDGHGWKVQSSPNHHGGGDNYLYGVSCPSLHACVAVGKYENGAAHAALVERWDGSGWSLVRAPSPAGALDISLTGVFCVTAHVCTAVGDYKNGAGSTLTLGERSKGGKWSREHTPNPPHATLNELDGVACPSVNACAAVGDSALNVGSTELTLAERWTR
jgi:hypothetical protein